MKLIRLIVAGVVALSLTTATLSASESKTKGGQKVTSTQFCLSVSELAKAIMQNRQKGTPMIVMIEVAGENKITQAIVIDAYSRPKYLTTEDRQKAVQSFTDIALMTCLKATDK